jgi:hypothetical protein
MQARLALLGLPVLLLTSLALKAAPPEDPIPRGSSRLAGLIERFRAIREPKLEERESAQHPGEKASKTKTARPSQDFVEQAAQAHEEIEDSQTVSLQLLEARFENIEPVIRFLEGLSPAEIYDRHLQVSMALARLRGVAMGHFVDGDIPAYHRVSARADALDQAIRKSFQAREKSITALGRAHRKAKKLPASERRAAEAKAEQAFQKANRVDRLTLRRLAAKAARKVRQVARSEKEKEDTLPPVEEPPVGEDPVEEQPAPPESPPDETPPGTPPEEAVPLDPPQVAPKLLSTEGTNKTDVQVPENEAGTSEEESPPSEEDETKADVPEESTPEG